MTLKVFSNLKNSVILTGTKAIIPSDRTSLDFTIVDIMQLI